MAPRLTSLSHGGGCGCKVAPGVLAELLKGSVPNRRYAELLVGTDTSDDAAVYRLNETLAVVATTDFFMPIVDDPFDFGRTARAASGVGYRARVRHRIPHQPVDSIGRNGGA